ncbi:DUF2726 domain-containing protein [Metallibacterium scheffleri]|uniref:DUF2726 domain-containing protein n=1 Tax=Metallibacterium scheffleri TaxID=993689 RepID=A0A4S3KQ53_9GAMM|nr:DUF2726 domain-containing protein [Metallibacterium scheffleri]THD10254.1 hypothetical protein B1806_09305 [Metallibacterium scheffleri]
MSLLVLLIVFALLVFVVLAVLKNKQGGVGSIGFPYQPAKALFSDAERSFLGVLDQAVGSEHRVFGKVRVADVAIVKPGLDKSVRQSALNRIASKHLDFVVCRAGDLVVVCAVELNDKSHVSPRAQSRDDLLLKVCQTITDHGSSQTGILATRYPLAVLGGHFSPASWCAGRHLTIQTEAVSWFVTIQALRSQVMHGVVPGKFPEPRHPWATTSNSRATKRASKPL